jgi:hypothetical protein
MYLPTTSLLPWLICIGAMVAIAIGAMLIVASEQEARRPYGNGQRIRSDRNGGVRFILAGVLILLAYAVWRLA